MVFRSCLHISSCLRQVPPPCQPSPLGGGCSNDRDYDDADDNVAGDDDDDDGDDDDHGEEEAELAFGQRWDWLQLADFVLNVAQVDRGQGGRNGRLWHETPFRFHFLRSSDRTSSYWAVSEPSGASVGQSLASGEASWAVLGLFWAVLGPSSPSGRSLGTILGQSRGCLGSLRAPSWASLRLSSGVMAGL